MKLEVELAPRNKNGLRLRNPVIMAAGTFGHGVEYARSVELHLLGALVCNGITARPHMHMDSLQFLETPAGLLSSFDRPSPGASKVLKNYAHIWASWETPVIANLACTSMEEFVALATRLNSTEGIAALELNLACPNSDIDGSIFGSDAGVVERLITQVRRVTDLPLIAKLAPYDGDIRTIALAAASAGADALSLTHVFPALQIDLQQRLPALSGGLSGPAIKPLALRLVYNVARALRRTYPQVTVIGIGGISNAHDALEFLMAGASAIQVGTINFVNPQAGIEIVAGIEAFLQNEGINDIVELIGAALPDE